MLYATDTCNTHFFHRGCIESWHKQCNPEIVYIICKRPYINLMPMGNILDTNLIPRPKILAKVKPHFVLICASPS